MIKTCTFTISQYQNYVVERWFLSMAVKWGCMPPIAIWVLLVIRASMKLLRKLSRNMEQVHMELGAWQDRYPSMKSLRRRSLILNMLKLLLPTLQVM